MKSRILAGLLIVGAGGILGAQAPAPSPMGGAPAAEMLLANTGRLQLTDAQVVRLAAIARRSEARRQTMRAAMDSARTRAQGRPADTTARRQMMQRMRTQAEQVREQQRTDMRDAIAVLNADQQARAWEMVASRGRAMRGAQQGRGMRRPMNRPGQANERMNRERAVREREMTRRPMRAVPPAARTEP